MVLLAGLLASLLALALDQSRAGQGEGRDTCKEMELPCGWRRGPAGEDQLVFSVAYISEGYEGHDLEGIRLSAVRWEESSARFPTGVSGGFWLAGLHGRDLHFYEGGVEFGGHFSPFGPSRIGLRAILGIVHRDSVPDRAWGSVEGLGVDLGIWLGRRVHLAATAELAADRINDETGTRTGIVLRVGTSRDR